MIVFPGTKINLGLYVHPRRPDGYHNLETAFYPTAFSDVLEILPAAEDNWVQTGLRIGGEAKDNLCLKALDMLRRKKDIGGYHQQLHKIVPTGAGLGGGSADGAAVITGLNTLGRLGMPEAEMAEMALELGSDCPFFIYRKPLLATGRGETFSPLEISLTNYHLLLVMPGIHVSTKEAFGNLDYQPVPEGWQQILSHAPETWENSGLRNDFEQPVFRIHPVLKTLKKQLYDAGAAYAAMSGSGSTLFGLFPTDQLPEVEWVQPVKTHWSACTF